MITQWVSYTDVICFFFSFLIQKRQVILEQNKAAGIKNGIIFKQKTFSGIVW